jgi:hypothetical protein
MRKVFSGMEASQKALLKGLEISPFDLRLREVRDRARMLFERAWPLAASKGLVPSHEGVEALYLRCLVWSLERSGLKVERSLIQDLPLFEGIIEEALS